MSRFSSIKNILLLAPLIFFTACDSSDNSEKAQIGDQLAQDRSAISHVVAQAHLVLCNQQIKPGANVLNRNSEQKSAGDRKAQLQDVFTPALVGPLQEFWQESPKTCTKRFPALNHIHSTVVDGDHAQTEASFSFSIKSVPLDLLRGDDKKWRISAVDLSLLREYEKTGRLPDDVDNQLTALYQRAEEQQKNYPAQVKKSTGSIAEPATLAGSSMEVTLSKPVFSEPGAWLRIGKYALYTLTILVLLGLVVLFWIGYGVVFGGHRRFRALCEDESLHGMPASERWAMAVGAPYAIVSDYHWAKRVVDSDPQEARKQYQNEVESLAGMWGVYDRETLLEQLLSLLQAGHRVDYEEQIKRDSKIPAEEYAAFSRQLKHDAKLGSDAKERLWQLRVARKNRRNVRQVNFCAWDMVRFVMLCNCGAQVGYISEREMVSFATLAAVRVQEQYHSWHEVAQQFLLARWYWKSTDKRHMISHYLFKKALNNLLKQNGSPWRTLPWNTPLTAGAEAAFAEACGVEIPALRDVRDRQVC